MAVYRGKKESFPNYALYAIDGSKAPARETLVGVEPETEGEVLSLLDNGAGERTPGWDFDLGSRGMCAFDDGRFYLVQSSRIRRWVQGECEALSLGRRFAVCESGIIGRVEWV